MIDHVSFTVNDLDKSCYFYTKLFGLRVIREWERKQNGLRAKVLGTEDRGLIEIIEYKGTKSQNGENYQDFVALVRKPGFTHISFPISDMKGTLKKLAKLGGKLVDGPKPGITVKSFAFVTDPEGITIELVELKPVSV